MIILIIIVLLLLHLSFSFLYIVYKLSEISKHCLWSYQTFVALPLLYLIQCWVGGLLLLLLLLVFLSLFLLLIVIGFVSVLLQAISIAVLLFGVSRDNLHLNILGMNQSEIVMVVVVWVVKKRSLCWFHSQNHTLNLILS